MLYELGLLGSRGLAVAFRCFLDRILVFVVMIVVIGSCAIGGPCLLVSGGAARCLVAAAVAALAATTPAAAAIAVLAILSVLVFFFLFGGLGFGAQDRLTVGDGDLVVVGVNFTEGEETVTVSAIFDECCLKGWFDPRLPGRDRCFL